MKTTEGKAGKNSQKSLEASELRYRRLFEAAQDGILILDAKTGMIEDVNPFLINMLGYSREEFIKKKLWDVGAFRDVKASKEAFEILQDREYIRYENLPLKTKAGRLIHVEFVSNVYVAGDEKVIQCNIRDITEHKRIVAVLQANERKYYDLLAMSPDGIFIIDLKGRILTVNKAMCNELGFSEEEFLAMKIWDIIPQQNLKEYKDRLTKVLAGEIFEGGLEYEVRGKDGRNHYVEIFSTPHYDETDIVGFQGIARDITARKLAEEALRESEMEFHLLAESMPQMVWITRSDGWNIYFNQQWVDYTGLTLEESSGHGWNKPFHPDDQQRAWVAWQNALRNHTTYSIECRLRRADGVYTWWLVRGVPMLDAQGTILKWFGTCTDINEIKRAEQALRESEGRYRTLFENMLNGLAHCRMIYDDQGRPVDFVYLDVNRKFGQLTGLENVVGKSITEVMPGGKESNPELFEMYGRVAVGGHAESLEVELKPLAMSLFISVYAAEPGNFVAVFEDITERKRAEDLRTRLSAIVESSQDAIFSKTLDGIITTWNKGAEQMYAYRADEVIGKSIATIFPADRTGELENILNKLRRGERIEPYETVRVCKDGTRLDVALTISSLTDGSGVPIGASVVARDITERKQAEEQVRSAREFLQSVQNALSAHIAILDQAGNVVQVNSAWRDFGAENGLHHPDHCIGKNYLEICDSAIGENAEEAPWIANAIREVLSGRQDEMSVEYPCHAPHEKRWFVARVTSFINEQQQWIVVAHENITARKLAEERTRRQFEHLVALSSIDRMISSNFDLKLTLSEILTHVTAELNVDAADILILDESSQTLEFGAGQGFRTDLIRNIQVRLGEGYAGRVAMERKTVQVKALDEDADVLFLNNILKGEGFSSYFGVPLITKGQVRGVLEIYHRSHLNPDNEWFEFLNTLAGQAAIAAENAMLFESLQRSNLELSLAYDATIEGWSRALDLRDKETEGHSLRVTQMTVELARALGLHEEELVQVRWGSLLHDIGKMGVPDAILLKPGELTEAEWVAMKKHPVFAYEMLSPIRYLRLALDIPYCHHEKWDGSGYPRGLKGDQIPLTARIFAVVDVWDALTSDRPYRAAWTKEEALAYIRASTGTHFDANVVDVFMRTIVH